MQKPVDSAGSPRFVEVALPLPLPRNFTYRSAAAEGAVLPEVGDGVRVPFGRRRMVGVVTEISAQKPAIKGMKEVLEVLPPSYRLGGDALELARWIAGYYGCSEGEALAQFHPPRPGTTARRSPLPEALDALPQPSHQLSPHQDTALSAILPALRERRFESFLLHGITGSGKTEIYLQAIEEVVATGGQALVLLPEIALTPQTLRRLHARFPGRVAPYHSRLSQGERCAVWEAAAEGRISVVVGARSCVFVPLPELGLIVVDEEHEPSYKADDRPRYHARDVALMRARLASVPVILGSATPSLETYHNAQEKKHVLLELPERLGGGELPEVEIVDLCSPEGVPGEPLGSVLIAALEQTLQKGEQAIVFHNRRGFARYLQCHACGHVEECPHCDISLTYHLKDDRLHCHYCGLKRRRPEQCAQCEAKVLRPRGTGTQRVELALSTLFPQARILRLDQDTTTTKKAHAEILEGFGRGEADILLGTQMVAKGLHFPGVTVVGVINADAGLHFPDFRAHERSFQLLAQVAGRSGRRGPGRVILQTYDPEHRVLLRAQHHDVVGFLAEELEQRRLLGYPPHRRLAAITVTCGDEALLDRALAQLARRVDHLLAGAGVQVLGPARAALARINRRYRGQLLLKGGLSTAGKMAILALFEQIKVDLGATRKLDFALDVDAQQLL